MPNPAKDRTVFHYALPEGVPQARLAVLSIDGQVVKSFGISESRGTVEWITKGVENGVYTMSLTGEGFDPIVSRIVVAK